MLAAAVTRVAADTPAADRTAADRIRAASAERARRAAELHVEAEPLERPPRRRAAAAIEAPLRRRHARAARMTDTRSSGPRCRAKRRDRPARRKFAAAMASIRLYTVVPRTAATTAAISIRGTAATTPTCRRLPRAQTRARSS